MSVPKYYEFFKPLLEVLADHPNGLKAAEAYERVADHVGLDAAQRDESIPSGQATYKNRIGWAQSALKSVGLTNSPEWGRWALTDDGHELNEEHPDELPDQVVEDIKRGFRTERSADDDAESADDTEASSMTPDERIDAAIGELHANVSEDLLELVRERPPDFFESLVLDVLHAMGYGTDDQALQTTAKTGDGGIDGIISLDRLGLEKVYVQAKRYTEGNNVGVKALRAFSGALREHQAGKGVFITTSRFTSDARQFADAVSDSIVLIDGEDLTEMMIDGSVGVRADRTVRVVEVDRDYFEEV